MSRYYDIKVTDANGKMVREWTSYPNGQNDPGALQIEMDLPIGPFATPAGSSQAWVRVWGIPISDIAQASNFNDMSIAVYGGMQKGFPLANPQQSGLLVSGTIFRAFGNWIGVNQTLDFIIYPPVIGSGEKPANIIHNWPAGTPLSQVIATTLQTAFPTLKQQISISAKLTQSYAETGYYGTLPQFAVYLKQKTAAIIGGSYPGVDIILKNGTLIITDPTTATTPTQIAYTDLIGQPTWIAPNTIQITCVMRADIGLSDYVKLPPTLVTTTQAAPIRGDPSFQGTFQVTELRHVGNFRNPAAESWATMINARTVTQAEAQGSG